MSEGKQIYKAIPAIIAEVGPVGKNSKNQQQGYNYRSADDISDALHDAFAKHGVFVTCKVESVERGERPSKSGGSLQVVNVKNVYTFHASDGSSISSEAIGDGMDSGDKAGFKALTGAFKYVLLPMFMLMGHEDAERDSPEAGAPPPPPPKGKSKAKAKEPKPSLELTEAEKLTVAEIRDELSRLKSIADYYELVLTVKKKAAAVQLAVSPDCLKRKGELLAQGAAA